MQQVRFKVKASTAGEPERDIATGMRRVDGSVYLASEVEPVPPEVFAAFDRHLREFSLSLRTFSDHVGDTRYQIHFSPSGA